MNTDDTVPNTQPDSAAAHAAGPAEQEQIWICAHFAFTPSWLGNGMVRVWAAAEPSGRVERFSHLDIVVSWLKTQTGLSPVDQSSGIAVYFEADFAAKVAAAEIDTASLPEGFRLAKSFELFLRTARLAREIVRRQDILAFAAPVDLAPAQVMETCCLLADGSEDGGSQWVAHHSAYCAAWLPAWTDSGLRALRRIYIHEMARMWDDPDDPNAVRISAAGPIEFDRWIWRCVDELVRANLLPADDAVVRLGRSRYRVFYRGEAELLTRWQQGLWAHDAEARLFPADGWLLRRQLLPAFADSGWRREWLADDSGSAYYHVAFEVVPPDAEHPAADWQLVYYVAHNEWPVRVPLRELWASGQRVLTIGRDVLVDPARWILPALRRAGQCYAPILQSLREPGPTGCSVPPEDVVTLVTEGLPALREQGFSVETPDFDAAGVANVRIRVRVRRGREKSLQARQRGRRPSAGWFDAERLVDFDWTLAVGDEELSSQAFEQLVEAHTPYIHLGGSWKLVPMNQILAQLKELGLSGRPLGAAQFSRALLLGQEQDEASPVRLEVDVDDEAMDAQRVIRFFLNAEPPKPVPTPQGFQGTLRQYQQTGYAWLLHLRNLGCGACLADDMGLGKTIQVLAYLQYLKEQGQSQGPHLLVCPTSLLQNWKAEAARFVPALRLYVHHGVERNTPLPDGRDRLTAALDTCDVVLTTYAITVRDAEALQAIAWDAVIADEAQNIKNADTKQARAVQNLHAHHRIALTGTPVENRLEELWSIFHFTNPGYLGGLSWFRKQLAGPGEIRPNSVQSRRLHRLVQPLLLRRSKSDPAIQMELPEKWEVQEYASLSAEQAALYQSIVNRLFVDIDGAPAGLSRRGRILAALVRLKQVCDHPCLVEGGSTDVRRSGKLGLLLELLDDVIDEGAAALVFTQFRDMGELLCDTIAAKYGWRPQFLHGGLSAAARGKIVEDFQQGNDPSPVLVLSLKAGGVGLNLTRANYVFHYDRWWNPAVEDQATDRVFRIGQTKNVQVHKLICAGTLEERIDQLIASKRQLSAAVIGDSAEGFITELDDAALRELFALDVDAMMEDEG
ncbi:DEAD/DEAH box helicase [Alicyclobacillus cycloheptanicus]|uniref:Superfamily II DNA or RNA helicase, SNF2 family n=1 Tax=Alicyclobacillus cycloheptanicus TaxID=1457 RepID=A0ABT9XKY8_9BACL|nr:DEAD/DEAH box helicase [Alicyclobacillus cycloheptanicus]MDQ0190877.1 hypothetical protein [Alicyclobacillus cycloheptanicus]WDM01766.1 DEAD/DEAH box helicase [Alicyclobacillus cycloheptanicus]